MDTTDRAMAESGGSMEALMETLHAQQELLQRLYTELDVEREAAATATSESLAMILRLQGEKAAVEMEASQYKRIAEEKIVHTEETLEIFRDVIYQKEMQIASLEFQLHSYRFKLASLGFADVSESEATYPENLLLRGRRGCSLPLLLEVPPSEGEASGESSVKVLSEVQDQALGIAKTGDFSSYLEQIQRLDEQVKQLSNCKSLSDGGKKLNEMSRSCSLHSQASSNSFYDAVRGETTLRESADEACEHPVTPSKVHDIFEVPQIPNAGEFANLPRSKEKAKLSPEDEVDPVTPVKTVISDDTDKDNWDDTFPKQQEGLAVEHSYFKLREVTDFELRQMDRRLKRLEMPRQEIALEKGNDELSLLNAIKDKLNSIEDEIQQWKPKKPPPPKKFDLTFLSEALLRCWL